MVSGKPPRRSVYATSRVTAVRRRYLNTFRGEAAISGHFTPTLRSSLRFAIQMGSGLHARVPRASPCPRVDHPVSGRLPATCRPFGLAFAPAPAVPALTSRRTTTRWLVLQKARRHRGCARLRPAGSARFQALFHSPRRGAFHRSLTVLVPYRSPAVFSLGSWSTPLPTRYHVSDGTHATQHGSARDPPYGALTPYGGPFQCRSGKGQLTSERSVPRSMPRVLPPASSAHRLVRCPGLGSSRFARRYSGNPLCSSRY